MDYLNNRYYDPTLGRFASVDPLVAITRDAYGYGNNNPIAYSDPSGLAPCADDRNCGFGDGRYTSQAAANRALGPQSGSGGPGTNGGSTTGNVISAKQTAPAFVGPRWTPPPVSCTPTSPCMNNSGPPPPKLVAVASAMSVGSEVTIVAPNNSSEYFLVIRDATYFPGKFTITPRYGPTIRFVSPAGMSFGDTTAFFPAPTLEEVFWSDATSQATGRALPSAAETVGTPQTFTVSWESPFQGGTSNVKSPTQVGNAAAGIMNVPGVEGTFVVVLVQNIGGNLGGPPSHS